MFSWTEIADSYHGFRAYFTMLCHPFPTWYSKMQQLPSYLNFIFYMKYSGEIWFLNEQVIWLSQVEVKKKSLSLFACTLHSAVNKSNAVIKPSFPGNDCVWIHWMCDAPICLSSDIAQRPQNPKKNKATFSQSQMVCFHMLFWQPFPVVVILPNSFKRLFNGEPGPISRAGTAAFTSLHVHFCFLCFLPDRKPSILPLMDLDCTSVGHQETSETESGPALHHASGCGVKNSRENLQQRWGCEWAAWLERDSAGLLERNWGPHRINRDLCSIKHLTGNPLFFL